MTEKIVLFTADEAERIAHAVKAREGRPQYVLPRKSRRRLPESSAAAASGGASGGDGLATNNCCSTIYLAGSVDLDGLEWATDYTITLAAPIGTVTVTDQGSGTWESDVVEVTCTVDEVTVTDEYTVTMTATGNAPGEVIVTVALTLGAGYGGASGCCDTTSTGFAWKFVNCCIVDPLAGWSMTRDPSGFSGQECEIGGCEICVTPVADVASSPCLDLLLTQESRVSAWPLVLFVTDEIATRRLRWDDANQYWTRSGEWKFAGCTGNMVCTVRCTSTAGVYDLSFGDIDPNPFSSPGRLDFTGGTSGGIDPSANYDPINFTVTKVVRLDGVMCSSVNITVRE